MPRKDEALLLDMLIACRKIIKFTIDIEDAEALEANELIQSAVMREFQVLGEAARMVSVSGKEIYEQIPWQVIAGLRNRIIHEYFNIDFEILWKIIQENVPLLITQLEEVASETEE